MLLSECECMTALCQCVTFVAPLRDMCYYCVTRSYRAHYIRDIVTLPVVTTSLFLLCWLIHVVSLPPPIFLVLMFVLIISSGSCRCVWSAVY